VREKSPAEISQHETTVKKVPLLQRTQYFDTQNTQESPAEISQHETTVKKVPQLQRTQYSTLKILKFHQPAACHIHLTHLFN